MGWRHVGGRGMRTLMTRMLNTWWVLCTNWRSEHFVGIYLIKPSWISLWSVWYYHPILQVRKWYRWDAKGLKSLSKVTEVNSRAGIWAQRMRCWSSGVNDYPVPPLQSPLRKDQLSSKQICQGFHGARRRPDTCPCRASVLRFYVTLDRLFNFLPTPHL